MSRERFPRIIAARQEDLRWDLRGPLRGRFIRNSVECCARGCGAFPGEGAVF